MLERRAQIVLELLLPHPPGDVGECGDSGRYHIIRERTLRDRAGHLAGPGERGDLGRNPTRAKIRRKLLGGHEAVGVTRAELLTELLVARMAQPISRSDVAGIVQRDGLRVAFLDESFQLVGAAENVVRTVVFDQRRADAQSGAFDPAIAAIGEDIVAVGPDVSRAEIFGQRIVEPFPVDRDPHVDAVLAHDFGQDQIEFLLADLVRELPAFLRLALGIGFRAGRKAYDDQTQE